jgi:HSP20 family protein
MRKTANLFIILFKMANRRLTVFNPSSIFSDDFMDNMLVPRLDWRQEQTNLEMYEDDDNVVVKLAIPGYKEEEIDISVEDNVLTISGNTREEEEDTSKKYYYKGLKTESFSRSITLPVRVKSDNADAEMKNGVLHVTLPKAEESKASKIMIKGKK